MKSTLNANSIDANQGNIVNFGFVAQQGDWIFFNKQHGDNVSLWKKNIHNKKDQIKIVDDPCWFLNVVDDWIYYSNADDNHRLYKIRTDGTQRTQLSEDEAVFINVVDGWIYYTYIEQHGIYKIRTDGTQRTHISEDDANFMNVVDNWIYYSDYSTGNIYKISTDGTQRILISEDEADFINVVDGWIYYVNNNGIFKISTEEKKPKTIQILKPDPDPKGGSGYSHINVQGEWIYFLNYNENIDYTGTGKIFKIRTDGRNLTKITDDRYVLLYILHDTIYAYDNNQLFRIRTDGTDRQLVD